MSFHLKINIILISDNKIIFKKYYYNISFKSIIFQEK